MKKAWARLNGHKTKIGNSMLLMAMQMPPGNAQTALYVVGSLFTGVGLTDILYKVILGKKSKQ